ncbi:hypothetical protein D7S86_00930 [Pararobbsia silviterrae]|uniref:Uncharacterized protein n=1 Tax=Pararobbsia silviterrae TaxID=1792498 RepID=A0A494YEP7_9BURK|nr:hypothetical protein D7S86_00930 [Pararobbsia silviterrae]
MPRAQTWRDLPAPSAKTFRVRPKSESDAAAWISAEPSLTRGSPPGARDDDRDLLDPRTDRTTVFRDRMHAGYPYTFPPVPSWPESEQGSGRRPEDALGDAVRARARTD